MNAGTILQPKKTPRLNCHLSFHFFDARYSCAGTTFIECSNAFVTVTPITWLPACVGVCQNHNFITHDVIWHHVSEHRHVTESDAAHFLWKHQRKNRYLVPKRSSGNEKERTISRQLTFKICRFLFHFHSGIRMVPDGH